jgi:hypothetical protein
MLVDAAKRRKFILLNQNGEISGSMTVTEFQKGVFISGNNIEVGTGIRGSRTDANTNIQFNSLLFNVLHQQPNGQLQIQHRKETEEKLINITISKL